MNQWQWLTLMFGAILIVLTTRNWSTDKPDTAVVAAGEATPDIYMEDARITQFDASGAARYRLDAQKISHFPDDERTELVAPTLTMQRADEAPWHIQAERGQVQRDSEASNASETVTLESNVILTQQQGDRAVRLETERLVVKPQLRQATTDARVLIETSTGRTIALGMQGDLNTGRLRLFSAANQRVVTFVRSIPR